VASHQAPDLEEAYPLEGVAEKVEDPRHLVDDEETEPLLDVLCLAVEEPLVQSLEEEVHQVHSFPMEVHLGASCWGWEGPLEMEVSSSYGAASLEVGTLGGQGEAGVLVLEGVVLGQLMGLVVHLLSPPYLPLLWFLQPQLWKK
jgi:hypothetical protein